MEYKEKLTKKSANDEVKGSAYEIGKTEDNKIITEMIFSGTTKEDNYAKAYWLASPGVYIEPEKGYFCSGAVYDGCALRGYYGLFYPDGYWFARKLAVRPIVSIKSEVTVNDMKVISKTEETWTGEGTNLSTSLESGKIQEGQVTVE